MADVNQRVEDASEYNRKEWKLKGRLEERHSCIDKYTKERIFPTESIVGECE
jgi:hypothetical protein